MLKSLVPKLLCPACQKAHGSLKLEVFTEGTAGHVTDGILVCESCATWYPIEDDLLELVTSSLLYSQDIAQFCSRFKKQITERGLLPKLNGGQAEATLLCDPVAAQMTQRKHFDWYAQNGEQTYDDYQNTPFWIAVDDSCFVSWRGRIQADTWLLDVGCADGRSAFPFVKENMVVGFDISKKMVRRGIERAKSTGVHGQLTFFVADATTLPIRDQSFDYVSIYGVLHHLPAPARTCRDVQRVLKPNGVYFGSENNKSVFRGIFDLLMKVQPLWTEEAGEEHLISQNMIEEWTKGLPTRITCRSSVFLPPHLFNLVGKKKARSLLETTDQFFSAVPFLKKQGGLIVFEVQKS